MAEDRHILMPGVTIDPTKRTIDDVEAAQQLLNLFTVILGPTGTWKTGQIPSERSANAYLTMARQIDGNSKQSLALQDYFYSMAIDRSSELSKKQGGDARVQLARVRLSQDRQDDADHFLRTAASLDPDNLNIRLAQAELNVQRGRYGDAITQYKSIVSNFPEKIEVYERLATLMILRNDNEGAAGIYQELIKKAPDASVAAYRGLARLSLRRQGTTSTTNWNQAAAFLETGIRKLNDRNQRSELSKELSDLYADAGRESLVAKSYQTALEFLSKSIATAPSVKAYWYRANTYYEMAYRNAERADLVEINRKLALSDYEMIVALADSSNPVVVTPEYIGSRLSILEIFTLQERYTEAIAAADTTIEIFKANKDASNLEPVARLIRLAAKIAANMPDYRQDVDELRLISGGGVRRYSFGSYFWIFDAIDNFVETRPNVPDGLKCLYRQMSRLVQLEPMEPEARSSACKI
jgi:tetratricopeptide (TPR) repeat protein